MEGTKVKLSSVVGARELEKGASGLLSETNAAYAARRGIQYFVTNIAITQNGLCCTRHFKII